MADNQLENGELELRKQIEDYYLPKQLVDAIIENGRIPETSSEMTVGIGFIDVADYTFLSKFLSPKENQAVLNGLYTALNSVLKRHGGYLNKIEGDSIMFHYGGLIDPRVKEMEEEAATRYIAKELFFSCVEMQRVCVRFNEANERFLSENETDETREVLRRAFEVIETLRTTMGARSQINALFQIRMRIGANIGEVTIGNFGPDGAKQWDIVGLPVINAKRMESTAPVGGLRISETFYRILERAGVVEEYYNRFKREAQALFGEYASITKDELFKFSKVVLKDKKSAVFNTYSIQVNPGLPENIRNQVELLLEAGDQGAEKILELLQYYRGNRFIIKAIEKLFDRLGVNIRKAYIIKTMYPQKYGRMLERHGGDEAALEAEIEDSYSLFDIFEKLGLYQDTLKQHVDSGEGAGEFSSFEDCMERETERISNYYAARKTAAIKRAYFYNYIYPLVFASIRTSIIEYQRTGVETAEVEDLQPA